MRPAIDRQSTSYPVIRAIIRALFWAFVALCTVALFVLIATIDSI